MSPGEVTNPQDPVEDEDYDSGADEDFNPDAPIADEDVPSSSDDEEPSHDKPKKRKDDSVDVDFDNSGDEATITRAKKKRRKTDKDEDGDDEGGEGGLVKTRAQRRTEGVEKKPLAQTGAASADVDALWAQMSGPSKPSPEQSAQAPSNADDTKQSDANGTQAPSAVSLPDEEMITIKRTYEFAGQKMEEEKTVRASSQEAKLYLEEQARKQEAAANAPKPSSNVAGLRRPKKRVSAFDSADSAAFPSAAKGTKLNTIEKSKLDWAAHVDQEGISEELDDGRRAKNNYLGRMDFLGRSDAKREDGR